jgi:hypothetical protein
MTVPSPKLRLKTDNHSLADKCLLRRMLINEAQLEPLRVLDLFAGEGNIWREMRRQPRYDPDLPFEDQPRAVRVEVYTPVDAASRQAGQLKFKITPRLIASLNGDDKVTEYSGTGLGRYNAIDVDCFGDPWAIWHELLFRIKTRTVVFLTRGKVTYGSGRMPISNHAKTVLGIPAEWNVPGKIELLDHADRCQLLEPCPTAAITLGYWIQFPRVDYYGLLVEPVESGNIK